MGKVCLGSINDIVDGQSKGYDPMQTGNDTIFIVRKGQKVYAYNDICPHYGSTSLPWKRHQYLDASCEFIVCAAHGALFDIEKGLCIRGACEGQYLDKIDVTVSLNNEIWVDISTKEESN